MNRVLVVFVGVINAVGALVLASPAGAAGPPLSSYVVYGENGVVVGNGSTVIGLVGAKNAVPGTTTALTLQGLAKIIDDPVHNVLGDARSGGNVRMLNNTMIQHQLIRAPGTTLSKSSSAVLGADVVADPGLPSALPPPTPIPGGCPTAGANQSGANNETRTLAPGTYGAFNFGSGFTLNLTAPGNYFFTSIHAGNGGVMNATPGVKIYTCGEFSWGGLKVFPVTLQQNDVSVEAQSNDDHNAFRIGGGVQWVGNVYTPNGGIHLGSGGTTGTVLGRLVAGQQVDLEHSLVVQGPGGGGHNQPSAGKDATMGHAAKNENNGANNSLRVHYQEDSLVGFNVTQLTFPATSAVIELTICHTPGDLTFCPDAPFGWPASGGRDTAMRLDDGWERWGSGFPNPTNTPPEGNGNNFPIENNPRGDGAGVTWNCAIDTNIANEAQNCSNANGNFWNAGLNHDHGFVNSTEAITNGMADGTKIHFDVTALYNEGIGPLDTTFMTFFIRKVANSGGGAVTYYSFQGAAAKSNPSLAPKLIVTP
jgi:hypothetical protein